MAKPLLASFAGLASLVLALPASADPLSVIRSLNAQEGRVEVQLSAPTSFHLTSLPGNRAQEQLPRCVVDLSPASIPRQFRSSLQVKIGPVQRVRLSQFRRETVRIVLDLHAEEKCAITPFTGPNRLVITVGSSAGVTTSGVMNQSPAALSLRADEKPTPLSSNTIDDGTVTPSTAPESSSQNNSGKKEVETREEKKKTETAAKVNPDATTVGWRRAPESFALTSQLLFPNATFAPTVSEPELPSTSPTLSPEPVLPLATIVTPVQPQDHNLPQPPAPTETKPEENPMRNDEGHTMSILTVAIGLLLAFLLGGGLTFFLSRKEKNDKTTPWEQRMSHLEDALQRAGVLNTEFFLSLESTQKRLELLLKRAEWTEQDLRSLLTRASGIGEKSGGKADQYATAALLLAEGEEAQQVARSLKLPLAQVRLVQELRRELSPEKIAEAQEKNAVVKNAAVQAATVINLVNQRVDSIRNGTIVAREDRAV